MKKNMKKWLIVASFVLLIAVGAILFWYMTRDTMDPQSKYWFDKMAKDGSLEGRTQAELQDILNNIVEEGMFNVSINARPVFESGDQPGLIGIENIEENHFYCMVELVEDETQDILYKSNGIKPGQYIEEITLDKNLPQGEYECTAIFTATDPESLQEVGQVNVKVVLNVLN